MSDFNGLSDDEILKRSRSVIKMGLLDCARKSHESILNHSPECAYIKNLFDEGVINRGVVEDIANVVILRSVYDSIGDWRGGSKLSSVGWVLYAVKNGSLGNPDVCVIKPDLKKSKLLSELVDYILD